MANPTEGASKKSILIAEDEQPLSKALSLKLTHEGFNASVANNGQEALDLAQKQTFDLILLDLIMPEVDGFGVLAELQKRGVKTPIIVTSNLGQESDIARAKSLGAKDYFVKSDTSLSQIVDFVKKYVTA